jgi:hypothetical protein
LAGRRLRNKLRSIKDYPGDEESEGVDEHIRDNI